MRIDYTLKLSILSQKFDNFWQLSGEKLWMLIKNYNIEEGAPVFTVQGQYRPFRWTMWTLGFLFGSAILQFEATRDERFLDYAITSVRKYMPNYLTHMGIHDHGFNIVSTYGNLLRLTKKQLVDPDTRAESELAVKVSGAVQASRWTKLHLNEGYIYSFKGPHSLFIDTMRTLRVLALSHYLGQVLLEEGDHEVLLLERLIQHGIATARYNVYYGEGRDVYDVWGRVAQESVFNVKNGSYCGPGVHQGYSPFSVWFRGLAWGLLGFAEELEFLDNLSADEIEVCNVNKNDVEAVFLRAAQAMADFYITNTPIDGIPYWDSGAPGLRFLSNFLERPADPFNPYEPVDSSAAVIAAQGLLRLGNYLMRKRDPQGKKYWHAGLTVLYRLLEEPYLNLNRNHQGLILHSVYNRPYGWDYIPFNAKIPFGEASIWGDYHMRELVLYCSELEQGRYLAFFAI